MPSSFLPVVLDGDARGERRLRLHHVGVREDHGQDHMAAWPRQKHGPSQVWKALGKCYELLELVNAVRARICPFTVIPGTPQTLTPVKRDRWMNLVPEPRAWVNSTRKQDIPRVGGGLLLLWIQQ